MIELMAVILAIVIVVTQIALQIIEDKDRKNGCVINHRDYTITGMWVLMIKEAREKRKTRKRSKGK